MGRRATIIRDRSMHPSRSVVVSWLEPRSVLQVWTLSQVEASQRLQGWAVAVVLQASAPQVGESFVVEPLNASQASWQLIGLSKTFPKPQPAQHRSDSALLVFLQVL